MAIKIPSIKSTKSSTTHVITFSDGIVITLTGSNTIATRKAAYEKAYALANPVVIPPVKEPEQPASDVTVISHEEFCGLSNVKGKKYKVIAGFYNQTADHTNIEDCVFDLTGVVVQNCYQALRIHGRSINVAYHGLSLKNIDGYQIEPVGCSKVTYVPGKPGTFIDNLTIDGFTFDGGGMPFHSDGDVLGVNKHGGVIKGFRFSNNIVKNNLGSKFMVYLGNGFDFNIFGNRFTNINKQNNEDNGMFYLKATGKLYNNIANDYQGYLARIWLHSIDGLKTVEVYNNLGYNGSKYGLIELQLPQVMRDIGAQPANARVFNNTAINLNTSNDWGGALLTLYNTFGQVEYFDNLGAQLTTYRAGKSTRDYPTINSESMVFGQFGSETKLIKSGQNIYRETKADVVDGNFKSLFKGIGVQ